MQKVKINHKAQIVIFIFLLVGSFLNSCTKIVPRNWEQIAYVSDVYKPEPTLVNCRNITPEKEDLVYVTINKSTREVISDSRGYKSGITTICGTTGESVNIRRREGISKEECLKYCTKEACNEAKLEEVSKFNRSLNWNFENADYDNLSGGCECWCTPYNTSKIVNILK